MGLLVGFVALTVLATRLSEPALPQVVGIYLAGWIYLVLLHLMCPFASFPVPPYFVLLEGSHSVFCSLGTAVDMTKFRHYILVPAVLHPPLVPLPSCCSAFSCLFVGWMFTSACTWLTLFCVPFIMGSADHCDV